MAVALGHDDVVTQGVRMELIRMMLTIEFEREDDGRWIADVRELPGVMVYGQTKDEARAKAHALAFRVLAERIERAELEPKVSIVFEETEAA